MYSLKDRIISELAINIDIDLNILTLCLIYIIFQITFIVFCYIIRNTYKKEIKKRTIRAEKGLRKNEYNTTIKP